MATSDWSDFLAGWWYKTFQSSFGLNKFITRHFRSRDFQFQGKPYGWRLIGYCATSGCACALPYFPREPPSGWRDVWWRHFRRKGPTRANIAQLLVAHAHAFQRTPSGSRDDWWRHIRHATSGHAQWYILYYYSKKKAREPVVRSFPWLTSLPVRAASVDVTSGDVASGSSSLLLLELSLYTTVVFLRKVWRCQMCRQKP